MVAVAPLSHANGEQEDAHRAAKKTLMDGNVKDED